MGLSNKLELFPGFFIILQSDNYHVEDHWANYAGRILHRATPDQPAGMIPFALHSIVAEEDMPILNPEEVSKRFVRLVESDMGGIVESIHWVRKDWGKYVKPVDVT